MYKCNHASRSEDLMLLRVLTFEVGICRSRQSCFS
jgi:hypothetical protein